MSDTWKSLIPDVNEMLPVGTFRAHVQIAFQMWTKCFCWVWGGWSGFHNAFKKGRIPTTLVSANNIFRRRTSLPKGFPPYPWQRWGRLLRFTSARSYLLCYHCCTYFNNAWCWTLRDISAISGFQVFHIINSTVTVITKGLSKNGVTLSVIWVVDHLVFYIFPLTVTSSRCWSLPMTLTLVVVWGLWQLIYWIPHQILKGLVVMLSRILGPGQAERGGNMYILYLGGMGGYNYNIYVYGYGTILDFIPSWAAWDI